jgi:hypothetical protein
LATVFEIAGARVVLVEQLAVVKEPIAGDVAVVNHEGDSGGFEIFGKVAGEFANPLVVLSGRAFFEE